MAEVEIEAKRGGLVRLDQAEQRVVLDAVDLGSLDEMRGSTNSRIVRVWFCRGDLQMTEKVRLQSSGSPRHSSESFQSASGPLQNLLR